MRFVDSHLSVCDLRRLYQKNPMLSNIYYYWTKKCTKRFQSSQNWFSDEISIGNSGLWWIATSRSRSKTAHCFAALNKFAINQYNLIFLLLCFATVSFGYILNGFYVGWSSKFFSFEEEATDASNVSWLIYSVRY